MATVTAVEGIDVSNLQGPEFPWKSWQGKIGFGMAKATEGEDYADLDFEANWDHMWWMDPHHLFPRFAYHYFHPGEDPVMQAEHLVDTVHGCGLMPGDNFVLDLEVSDDLIAPLVAARAATFLRKVNSLAPGHRVLVYTYPDFARQGNCAGLGGWYLWLADYGVSRPAVPKPWTAWTFWQWTSEPIDRDRYNGTQEQLLAFCRMPAKR